MKLIRVILIVLLLVCCSLWVASYWGILWVSSDGLHYMLLKDGVGGIAKFKQATSMPRGLTIVGFFRLETDWWPAIWMNFATSRRDWTIYGACWFPTLLLTLSIAITMNPWARRRRRVKQGLCIRCGYDLQGAEHEACPECGDLTSRARQ